jgi:hypothetical protein
MATGEISRKRITRAALLLGLPFIISSSSSFADNSTLASVQPNFSGIAGGGVTANVGNCFTGSAAAAGGAIGGQSALNIPGIGKKSGAADLNSCGSTAVPDAASISCDSSSVQTNGAFDPKKLQSKINDLNLLDGGSKKKSTDDDDDEEDDSEKAKVGSLTCELNDFGDIKQEMACVQNQGQLLNQQIGALSQVYQQNITRFQKDDQAYKQREGDRQTQLDTIQKLLGGNKNSGSKGLLGEQADLQKLVNDTMPQDIAQALAQAKTVANQRAVIVENVQKHTMSLTGDCFKTQAKAGYKCTPGGPDLSPENYIVCMYGKYAHVKNGTYVQGALADSNAQAAQNTLQGIMDQMTSQTALSWSTPTDPTSAAATAQKPSYGNTIQDLITNFVNQTGGMTVNGISVATTITNELQSCYLAAQAEVSSERTDPSSAISQAQFQQTQSETALKAGFDQKVEQYTQKWTEAMSVLAPGSNLVPNLQNCKNQDITYEGNCMTDVQNQITSLLKGDGTQAPFTMNVPAQFPDTQIPTTSLQCQGVNGCVTVLQALNDQVTQAKTTLTTQRQSYETQARQSTDQFTAQVAALMNNQSAQLRKQLASVNSSLQGLGVAGNIGFPNVKGAPMQYESNQDGSQGLPKVPDDVVALISGKMSPPMMDLTDNSNNDGSALADGVKKVKENLQKVQKVRSDWEAKMSECGRDTLKENFEAGVRNMAKCSDFCSNYVSYKKGKTSVNSAGVITTDSDTEQWVANDSNNVFQTLFQAINDKSFQNGGGDDSDVQTGKAHLAQKDQDTEMDKEMSVLNSLLNGCTGDSTAHADDFSAGGAGKIECSAIFTSKGGTQATPATDSKPRPGSNTLDNKGATDSGNAN